MSVPGAIRAAVVFFTGLSLASLSCIMTRFGRRSMETVVMASRRLQGAANWPAVCTSGSYIIEGPRRLSSAGAARCETQEVWVTERGELSFSLAVPPSGSWWNECVLWGWQARWSCMQNCSMRNSGAERQGCHSNSRPLSTLQCVCVCMSVFWTLCFYVSEDASACVHLCLCINV